jgi:hypothetical protein
VKINTSLQAVVCLELKCIFEQHDLLDAFLLADLTCCHYFDELLDRLSSNCTLLKEEELHEEGVLSVFFNLEIAELSKSFGELNS